MIRVLTADELQDVMGNTADAGLGAIETAQGCLPLTALDVDVQIEGLAAETTVCQQFRNVFDEPLEATYIFPLPPRAAVTGFRMTVNDSVIEGRIDERGQARADYDAAIAEGRTASIAEQERADIFTLRVGNIPPKSTVRIELMLVAPVAIDSLEATYRFPLVVSPRYCPGFAVDGDPVGDGILVDTNLVPDASRISPPVLLPGFKSPVMLGIRVRIADRTMAAASATGSLGCTLPATEDYDTDGGLTVTVVPEQRLDRDFILRWGIAADAIATTTLIVEPDAGRPEGLGTGAAADEALGDGTFSLVIVPPAQAAGARQSPRDIVFLLDRSGSMGGWKIVAARRAVARMIDTLNATDRVSVVAFDNAIQHCADTQHLAFATDRHRWSVLERLGSIESRGGTELAAALHEGFRVLNDEAVAAVVDSAAQRRDRVIVLVTDGQVGDEDRVLAGLLRELDDATLFVVGIDTAVNEGLLSRMADASGGMAEMVESEDRLDAVMERIHQRLATPLVTELSITGKGLDIIPASLVPAKLPNLVPGVPLVVRGRYRGKPAGGIHVGGRQAAGAAWQERAEATASATSCQGSLWARGRLRHLEDVYDFSDSDVDTESLVARMVELSTAFGVLCRFTAIVAIDPRQPDRKLDAVPMRRIVQSIEMRTAMLYQMAPGIHAYCDGYERKAVTRETLGIEARRWHQAYGRNSSDPLEVLGRQAGRIISKTEPRSGALGDVTAGKVRALLRAVLSLLRSLGAIQASSEIIESLATAYGRLYAMPGSQQALVAVLDVLAGIAGKAAPADPWWHSTQIQEQRCDDVPF